MDHYKDAAPLQLFTQRFGRANLPISTIAKKMPDYPFYLLCILDQLQIFDYLPFNRFRLGSITELGLME
jgi:hypothetical protein